jgi:hypothetical protein
MSDRKLRGACLAFGLEFLRFNCRFDPTYQHIGIINDIGLGLKKDAQHLPGIWAKGFHLMGMLFRRRETTRFQIVLFLMAHAGSIETCRQCCSCCLSFLDEPF